MREAIRLALAREARAIVAHASNPCAGSLYRLASAVADRVALETKG